MMRSARIVPVILALLSGSTVAWAGGSTCSGKAEATAVKAGSHCSWGEAAARACGVKAGQTVYSFAVPEAGSAGCVGPIQKAAMARKGVACAHVDLTTHTAYIIADKGADREAIGRAIQQAGYKCTFKAQGPQVQAEFAKALASGKKNGAASCARKDREKV